MVAQGDRVRLTFRERSGLRVVLARVNWTEEREAGLYFGYTPDDCRHGMWGAAMLRPEAKPFGLQRAEVL